MQKFFSILALLALTLAARAQVNVEVRFEEEQFLRGESVILRLKISNFSGQPLRLADAPGWLGFTVTGEGGKALRSSGPLPEVAPFTIGSAQTVALRVDLAPYYEVQEVGRFTVSARVNVPQLRKEVVSDPKYFDIVSGVKIWQMEVGVPGTTPPELRMFALQQATFLKETRLFARVTKANEASVIRVVPLGALPASGRPEAAVDNSSQMHVIFQAGQKNFTYAIITPEGDQIIRQTYDVTTTRPRLRAEKDGRIVVQGGARRLSTSDLPPPTLKPATNDVVQVKE